MARSSTSFIKAQSDHDRFMAFVSPEPNTGCWLWVGHVDRLGYGRFTFGTARPLAHRMSYRLFVGDVGDLLVCHRCDNPPCVNPAHLFLGTVSDNARDSVKKGRWGRARRYRQGARRDGAVNRGWFPRGDDHPKRRAFLARQRGETP